MGEPRLQTVVVTVRPSGATRDDDREALRTAVALAAAVDVTSVRAGRVCPHCSATDHGRPWASVADRAVGVSLARTPGVLAVAVSPELVGVDVERVSRVTAHALDAFTTGELDRAAGDPAALAACWAAKEAVLKRDGRGLRVDPSRVDVDLGAGVAVLDGVAEPVVVARPEPDVVVAVAAGGVPVTWGA
ncbi:4'-phosphopantetheinyl transferase superfamily protein [Curtobacterium pusillum]|uniref:4'-phosphopantetheinyl transferase superfamily protein n=1 Tax=Curtobacterium pusillum TaxID=69373 RepID=UPI0011A0053C|nr:4'-phosphopantetheinyl transferase superfamily protein [Curtobacterium pusillum]